MLTDSRLIVARLQRDGWTLQRTKGSHQIFRHPTNHSLVVVPHPKKDLPIGTVLNIDKTALWPKD